MANFELQLPATSFYRETKLLQSEGKVFFGLWKVPAIKLDGDEMKVRVTERDRGRLDRIAFEELGSRELVPAIQIVNKIDYVPRDVVPGMTLIIPKLSRVYQALQGTTGGR